MVSTATDDRYGHTGDPLGFGPPRKNAKPFYEPPRPLGHHPPTIELASPTCPSCIITDITFRRKDVCFLFLLSHPNLTPAPLSISPTLYGKKRNRYDPYNGSARVSSSAMATPTLHTSLYGLSPCTIINNHVSLFLRF